MKLDFFRILKIFKFILRISACYALFNEQFGFAAIWFASAEFLGLFQKKSLTL